MGFNDQVITEFRANNGRVGGPFEGADLVLLTTAGRRTGRPHTTPTVYRRDGDRLLVFGSNAGAPTHPHWYLNLLASPQVTVEIGTEAGRVQPFAARAEPLGDAERDREWATQCSLDPGFRDYQARTTRTIPVVALHPLDLSGDPERGRLIARQLLSLHDGMRDQLRAARAEFEAALAGGPAAAEPRPARPVIEQLHRTCLTFCHGLQLHHTREDGAFTAFERQYPALRPALDRLRAEHEVVARSLAALDALLSAGLPGDRGELAALRAEFERVAAGLEEHFAYEEEQLLAAVG